MTSQEFPGLNQQEAVRLLEQFGYNELPGERKRTIDVFLEVLREPMLLLLMGSAVLYFAIGDKTESLLLLGSAVVVVAINIVQDARSARALEALRELTSPRAMVVRDGIERRIPAREVVPGDKMLLAEGDRTAADATLLIAMNLLADESLLTGESMPVPKSEDGDASVLSGSLIVGGSATVRVTATGGNTELGKIGRALATIEETKTPLELATRKLVRKIAVVAIACCVLAAIAYYLTRGGWAQSVLAGVALAMALLPEEFPVVLSVFLALGARRLSKRGILVRRLSAVEALGTVTTLCVDKTGTLTKNEMTVVELYTPATGLHKVEERDLEAFRALVEAAVRSSRDESFDPMDRAVFAAAKKLGVVPPKAELLDQFPVSHDRPLLAQVWQMEHCVQVAMKGAPEAVLSLTNSSSQERDVIHATIQSCAERSLRILAVAETISNERCERLEDYSFKFLGLLVFADPLREEIPQAVRECYTAGVRVVMITGDHPETARAIAAQAGIRHADLVIRGAELGVASKELLTTCNIFARVTPSQKLEIVQTLQKRGEIVVMTGDGVNDAPALKAANIGVAMGSRGTDVAREAAAVVLTKDDFGSLVAAVRLGRRTYANIKKAMYYIVAVHLPIAGLSLGPLLFGLPILLFPVHIVLLELLLDPMSTLVFESEGEEANIMLRPPRDTRAPVFERRSLWIAAFQGMSILIGCSAVYLWAIQVSELEARTLTFVTLVLANLCLALVDRSWTKIFWASLAIPNRALWSVTTLGIAAVIAITQIPSLSHLFQFGPFHLHDWVICFFAAALSLAWFELLKLIEPRMMRL